MLGHPTVPPIDQWKKHPTLGQPGQHVCFIGRLHGVRAWVDSQSQHLTTTRCVYSVKFKRSNLSS